MIIDVDQSSPVPAFEQVRAQLSEMIAAGALPAGYRLPSIRQLAADLGLAPGTVARVYRELEGEGLVRSRVRHGTVVAEAARLPGRELRAQLHEAARSYAVHARRLGAADGEALAAVREELDRLGR